MCVCGCVGPIHVCMSGCKCNVNVIHNNNIYCTHVYICESRNSMQYRSPNRILKLQCLYYCHSIDTIGGLTSTRCDYHFGHRLDTIGIRTSARCDFGHSIGSLSLVNPITLLIYAD